MKQLFNHSKIASRFSKMERLRLARLADFMGKRELCSECKPLGYCIIKSNASDIQLFGRFTVKDYLNLVPVHFYSGKMGKYSKFHLQVACDAFHQEDYETAILNFRAVLEADNYYDAILGLAVAYLMVKDYDNAAIFAERCSTSYTPVIIESLRDDIAKLALKNATVKEEANTETVVNAVKQEFTKHALVC